LCKFFNANEKKHIEIITRLNSSFGKKFISKLSSISSAILAMKGRVTMLGISR